MIVWTKKDIRCEGVGIFNIRKSLVMLNVNIETHTLTSRLKAGENFVL
jgi:hypothetical protein